MPITEFQVAKIDPGSKQGTVKFNSTVLSASVAVQGFSLDYNDTDHHVEAIEVKPKIDSMNGATVTVSATCYMDDNSGHRADGTVEVLVIAWCE